MIGSGRYAPAVGGALVIGAFALAPAVTAAPAFAAQAVVTGHADVAHPNDHCANAKSQSWWKDLYPGDD
jgi:hypothetical protein